MNNKPKVKLAGEDGNAYAIMAECKRAAKKAGWTNQQIDAVLAEMMSGDYSQLLATACKHFEVS